MAIEVSLYYTAVGRQFGTTIKENSIEISQKSKTKSIMLHSYSTAENISNKMKSAFERVTGTPMFIAAQFTIC